MQQTDKGIFVPRNPQKVISSEKAIQYRSSWELTVQLFLDTHPSVIAWGSECIQVPYKHPLKNRWSVYIPDFVVIFIDKAGQQHVEVWEVKPYKECAGAVPKKNKSGKLAVVSQATKLKQAVNGFKWSACRHYCQSRGWSFRVITEQTLFGYKPPGRGKK